jgi:hypothetical protein
MQITAVKKGKGAGNGRKQLVYLCEDGVWRSVNELVAVSGLIKGTVRQRCTVIRNRIQIHGYSSPYILIPETPKGRRLDGSKIRRKGQGQGNGGKPCWGGLSGKERENDLPPNGRFDDLMVGDRGPGSGGAQRYLGC